MQRCVEPEMLDRLPADNPDAILSRRDLQRVNGLMGHAGILNRALQNGAGPHHLRSLVELGAGDGTFMLDLARQLARRGHSAEVQLVDQFNIVSADTQRAFTALGWRAEAVQSDVFGWLAEPMVARSDLLVANLFLHHFLPGRLGELFRLAAERTNCFVACEPRRSPLALTAARLLGVIGCNAITRHDAVVSVRAGFNGQEISALWPARAGWRLAERPAGLFSHCFIAQRL